jgi:small subunit ribosomal protein S6
MYILRPDINEQVVDSEIAKYQAILQEQDVEDLEIQHRGRRRLAYEIDGHREGVYIQMNYNIAPAAIKPMEKEMKFDEYIIREMTIKTKPIAEVEEEESDEESTFARGSSDNGVVSSV